MHAYQQNLVSSPHQTTYNLLMSKKQSTCSSVEFLCQINIRLLTCCQQNSGRMYAHQQNSHFKYKSHHLPPINKRAAGCILISRNLISNLHHLPSINGRIAEDRLISNVCITLSLGRDECRPCGIKGSSCMKLQVDVEVF